MTSVRIQRTSEYNNRLRNFQVFLDGENVGSVANGETKDFAVSPGMHRLVARIDWCSSPEISFNIDENGTRVFKVGGFKYGSWMMPIGVVLVIAHFVLKATMDFGYLLFFLIPIFLVLVYYLTIGKKKYLTLTPL